MNETESFSAAAWRINLDSYRKICLLPFNVELGKGILDPVRFQHYMIQDAHYLEGFGRALSLVSAKGWSADHVVQFAAAAQTAILVERSLHAEFFDRFGVSQAVFQQTELTPVCEHYVSYLLRLAALEPFEVALAALLPCFWIYREVGKSIHAQAAQPNPYQAWIDTYAGEEFEQAVDQVIVVVDQVAEQTSSRNRLAMQQAFRRAVQLEWMFWDSAYRLAGWPIDER